MKWEYLVDWPETADCKAETKTEWLDANGKEEWELVCITPDGTGGTDYIFKRPLKEPVSP